MKTKSVFAKNLGKKYGIESDGYDDDDVIIHQDGDNVVLSSPTDEETTEVEDLSSFGDEVTQITEELDDADESIATLESISYMLNQQLRMGGMSRDMAQMTNVSLESVAMRHGLPAGILAISLEDNEDDSEEEVKRTQGRVAKMTNAIKSLANKAFDKLVKTIKNLAMKYIDYIGKYKKRLQALKDNLQQVEGGKEVKVGVMARRGLITGDGSLVSAQDFNKELQKATKALEGTFKLHAGEDTIANVTNELFTNISKGETKLPQYDKYLKTFESIARIKAPENTIPEYVHFYGSEVEDVFVSDTYLGGWQYYRTTVNKNTTDKMQEIFQQKKSTVRVLEYCVLWWSLSSRRLTVQEAKLMMNSGGIINNVKPAKDNGKIMTSLSHNEMQTAISTVEKLLDIAQEGYRRIGDNDKVVKAITRPKGLVFNRGDSFGDGATRDYENTIRKSVRKIVTKLTELQKDAMRAALKLIYSSIVYLEACNKASGGKSAETSTDDAPSLESFVLDIFDTETKKYW